MIISHPDRPIFDAERLARLKDTGCVLEGDLFGQESSHHSLADVGGMIREAIRERLPTVRRGS